MKKERRELVLLPSPRTVRFDGGTVRAGLDVASSVEPAAMPHDQGYTLDMSPGGPITIRAHDRAGEFYARQTLTQIRRLYGGTGVLPAVHIEDWPDFPSRGIMLDISRCKVPTMETLFGLVDMFAGWKLNTLQLYTEHTFAYKGHEAVWKDASPMTPDDVRALDAYCRDRFVDLVPNQNSFGHMERWLRHPRYAPLAEREGAGDLCPVDPACVDLLRGLYADLLPNFSSRYFNVGCDETWSLGKGRSKAEADRIGEGRVYLDFLKKIHGLVLEHGRTMQFWGDIIMRHRELIPELPPGLVAMEWGYEANHPFAEHGARFAASGIPFHVVPGTSSWNSLLGRTDNALENLRNAARNGLANGASGFLVTDWGDGSHWQFIPVSFAAFAYGAALSWAYDANIGMPLPEALDRHVFLDAAGMAGQAAMDLGNAHLRSGVTIGNSSVYYAVLRPGRGGSPPRGAPAGLSAESAERAAAAVEEAMRRMRGSAMKRPDAATVVEEFDTNAGMAGIALRLGRALALAGGAGLAGVPPAERGAIAGEIGDVVERFRRLWLARNRPGGLSESAGGLTSLADALRSPAQALPSRG